MPVKAPLPKVDLTARELSFDDVSLESRLTWIWGSPRSGSTWLLQLLSHPLEPNPEIELGFEPRADAGPGPFDSVPVDESFISNHLSPAFADPRRVDGRWVPGTLNNYLAASKPTYALSDSYRDVWMPEFRRLGLVRLNGILDRARQAGVPLTAEPQVVIKETNGSHAADLVMGLMPRSRILLLVRDPRDVVDSLLAAYQPGGFLANNQGQSFGTPAERAEGLVWAARLWACNTDMTLKAMEAHDPELCRIVRYEDLLSDTVGEVTKLYSWLGLERTPEWLEAMVDARSFARIPKRDTGPLTRNRSGRAGGWRENLSPAEQETITEIFGPLIGRLGYDD